MGSPRLAALLLPLLLLIGLSASSGIGCPYLLHWSTHCLLASHMVRYPHCPVGTAACHRLVKVPTLRPVLSCLPSPCFSFSPGPEFSFELLPEARAIRVTIPPGPEVSVRLCHQWALECEELSSPFEAQKIVSGGHAVDLPYEFFLPCLCIEVSRGECMGCPWLQS
uniref:Interleukin-17 receptor C/E N-terminal domain-containing protein n=1 Tax=Panthera leo TaxID=9689 RepID=A0A8C8WQ87_PANLE